MKNPRRGDSSWRESQRFGIGVGSVLVATALFRYFAHGRRGALFAIGGVLLLLGFFAPRVLYLPHRLSMRGIEFLGIVITRAVLVCFYYIILTPIGLLRRLFVRDPLELRLDASVETYFHEHNIESASQLERMFS